MKDVLLYLIENIALEPKTVTVEEESVDSQITYYITCAPDDVGRIIGKKGKVIKALRRILSILAVRENKRVNILMTNTPSEQ